jgi:hypothetical protein
VLLGLSVLLLTAAALPAPASVCRQDNLWAEEVVLAELAPEAEALLTEDPDWGLLCPGVAAAPQAAAQGALNSDGACAPSRLRHMVHSGRCEVRFGGKARVFMRQRAAGSGRHLLVAAGRAGPQRVGQASSQQPYQGDDGVSIDVTAPHLPRPGPAGSLGEIATPPLDPGFQRGIDRPPRFA